MNMTRNVNDPGKIDRDRLLGQALTKALAAKVKDEQCLPLEDIAALVDGALDEKRRNEVMGHLAGCKTCYQVFLSTREIVREVGRRKRRQVYVASGFAAAAVLLLALSIILRESGNERQKVAKQVETGAPTLQETLASKAPNKPGVMAHVSQKQKEQKEFVPIGAGGMAEMVARGIDPERLRGLFGERDRRSYGFADAHDAGTRAFRLGVASVDLEVSLLKEDRESALRHISKLLRILNSFDELQVPVAALEDVRDTLAGNASPENVKGVTEKIRKGLSKDLRIYLDFGMWSEAARIAAVTRNSVFFKSDAVAYFRKNLPQNKETADSLKALEAMEPLTKVKEITPQDFALLEKSIAKIIHQK